MTLETQILRFTEAYSSIFNIYLKQIYIFLSFIEGYIFLVLCSKQCTIFSNIDLQNKTLILYILNEVA